MVGSGGGRRTTTCVVEGKCESEKMPGWGLAWGLREKRREEESSGGGGKGRGEERVSHWRVFNEELRWGSIHISGRGCGCCSVSFEVVRILIPQLVARRTRAAA
jgi:hypothetical protein